MGAVCEHPLSAPRFGACRGEREEHVAGQSPQAPRAGPSMSGVGRGRGQWGTVPNIFVKGGDRILQKRTNVFGAELVL